MRKRSMFVGLDVHKETIDVSIADGDRQGETRHYGVIASDLEPLDKVVRALRAPDRDSLALARLHRAGELRPIDVPDDTDEAMRDLVRAREDAVVVGTQAKYRLKAFLLRQGRRYPGRAGWTLAYRRWLTDLRFPSVPQHVALQEYRDTIGETERRIERLTEHPIPAALGRHRRADHHAILPAVGEVSVDPKPARPGSRELPGFIWAIAREVSPAR